MQLVLRHTGYKLISTSLDDHYFVFFNLIEVFLNELGSSISEQK